MGVPMYEYVVYKGDEVICSGTKDEVVEKLCITKDNLDSQRKWNLPLI
ncbi:hypothetical protein [Staphylococcus chromogenes]|nr:hypothetical protein [Staphylococcus chromogenes]